MVMKLLKAIFIFTWAITIAGTSAAQNKPANQKPNPKNILLIPVDDRPAVAQFAQMIGQMAGVKVTIPPKETLGQFLQPGNPNAILNWLQSQDINAYDAVIVSTDMIAYGGLIASRVDRSSYNLASIRLRDLWKIRKTAPTVPFYAFSSLMRIAPTATEESFSYRTNLYYWAIAKEKYRANPNPETKKTFDRLSSKIPQDLLTRYPDTRKRNVDIQTDLVKMVYHGAFSYLVLGQDDALPAGPQVPEIEQIDKERNRLRVAERVQYCSGIDQISNNLTSRVISDLTGFRPTIKVAYADDEGKKKIAAYESIPIEQSLRDQVINSGGRFEKPGIISDYTLYVNTPNPNPTDFDKFLLNLKLEADQGFPVAVADTNLGWTGTADPNLFEAITENRRVPKLLGYAGWNTAGNTMGTTIPAANAYLIARHIGTDPLKREIALRTFLLHRLVNDYYYHRYVRPEAYKLIEKLQNGRRDQVTPQNYQAINQLVQKQMMEYLIKTFDSQMKGRPIQIGDKTYRATNLKNIEIKLPWARAYEVYIDFEVQIEQV